MYTYRNSYTGERRRFLTLQRSPWQLVEDSRDDDDVTPLTAAIDVNVGLASILNDDSSSSSSWDSSSSSDSSSSDNSFSGGGGDFGGGGSSGDW